MNILKQYPENLDKKTVFRMTEEDTLKMSDVEGQELKVDAFVLYEDLNRDGEEVELLSIMSGEEVYSTVSKTFIEKFKKIDAKFSADGYSILVEGGTSKAGRHYLSCKVA